MKSSNIFKSEQGVSALIVLIVVVLTALVLFQVNSLTQNEQGSSKYKNQLTKTNLQSKTEHPQSTDVNLRTEKIQKYLITEAALLGVTDNISFYFEDAQNKNEVISLEPTKSWTPASTIKAYVLIEAFRQKRLGLINFDQQITIDSQNVVPTELETEEFPRLREGTTATIRQLVETMIIQSDNTAYNSLLDILDRRNINNSLKNLGITETVVGEKLNLDASQILADLPVPGRQANTTTVKDLASYFSLLQSHQIPDSEEILSIFKRQKINNMIPARLPENTVVAHKTGDFAPIYHDGGIVYKPQDPFIFVTFTNSGDPAVVAKLAQVAYYQDSKYVGQNITLAPLSKRNLAFANRPTYYTTQQEQVLGEATPDKFPNVTAEDLGITSKDLMPDLRQINNVPTAWIVPGSVLYSLKRWVEDGQLKLSFGNNQKAKAHLNLANNRLSEIKSLLSQQDVEKSDKLLSEAVSDIKNATDLAKDDPQKDKLLIEIKKTNDLYYAVMEQKAANLPDDKKEQFVDAVYNFYQKGKAEISPIINSSVIVTPTQQKPTVGTIDKISSGEVSLKFDDGSTKQVSLSAGTNVRSVDQDTSQDLSSLKPGTKIAVLGPTGTDNIIDAQFILNNIPQGLTDQHKGTVTEINPSQGLIKVIDQKGQVNLVKVDDNTAVKARDTNVSLEGIKAGSQVVVFGVSGPLQSTPSASPSGSSQGTNRQQVSTSSGSLTDRNTNNPNPSSTKPVSSLSNGPNAGASSKPVGSPQVLPTTPIPNPTNQKPVTEIRATSVTVVGNSSGKKEQSKPAQSSGSSSKSSDSKPASQPAAPPAQAPAQPQPAPKSDSKNSSSSKSSGK